MLDDNSREVLKLTKDVENISRRALQYFLKWAIKTLEDFNNYKKTHGEVSEEVLYDIAKNNNDEVLTIKDADEKDHVFNTVEIEAIKLAISQKGGAISIKESDLGYKVSFTARDSQIVLNSMKEVAEDIANGKFDSISSRLKQAQRKADEHNKTLSKEKNISQDIGAR